MNEPLTRGGSPVAVVGMGLAVAGASDPQGLWELLHHPRPFTEPRPDRIEQEGLYSADRSAPDRCYARVHGFMTDFRPHPRLRAELERGEFPDRDPVTLWLRHCVLQALSNVTVRPDDRAQLVGSLNVLGSPRLEESLVVDAVAASLAGAPGARGQDRAAYAEALRSAFPAAWDDPSLLLPYRCARRAIAGLLPEPAGVLVVDAACSSSLYAIDLGAKAVRAGDCDIALCGGVNVLTRVWLVLLSRIGALSARGQLRALDTDQDGTVFADGAAVLALKRYERARADGDHVLGVVHGSGGSSDGRGKSLYAPNSTGQVRAVRRALAAAGNRPDDLDWIVTHGTGTVVGDQAELTTLRECAGPDTHWELTSTKSAIGHTAQASGAASAVHVLLALARGEIPAQQRFHAPIDPELVGGRFNVPTSDIAWPARNDRGRLAGINSFGLGGSNAHLILGDRPPRREPPTPHGEPLVLVDWAAWLPGGPDRRDIRTWLASGRRTWPDSFGIRYPIQDPVRMRIPPPVLAHIDRTQLMVLSCALRTWDRIGERCDGLRERTGVFIGQSGPSRTHQAYAFRTAADYARGRLARLGDRITGGLPPDRLVELATAAVPAATADTAGGATVSLAAGRIASRLDLHGPGLAVDAGRDSGLAALDVAARYLAAGDIDLALVGAVNGQDADSLPFQPDVPAAEGGFMIALTRASVARANRLPVLARLRLIPSEGTVPPEPGPSFLAADRLIAVIRAAVTTTGRGDVAPVEDTATRSVRITPTGHSPGQPPERLSGDVTRNGFRQWTVTPTATDLAILDSHRVGGRPTTPAALLIEFAVQAAGRLAPDDLVPVAVSEARFTRYLRRRIAGDMPRMRITARRLPAASPRQAAILVALGVTPPDADDRTEMRESARMTVHFAAGFPTAQPYAVSAAQPGAPVVDPYQQPGGPVSLDGVFTALAKPTPHPDGAHAQFRIGDVAAPELLATYRLPLVAIDCLFRIAAMTPALDGLLPVAVPTAVSRITLHTGHNDMEIDRRYADLELVHRGTSSDPDLVLLPPDGTPLLRMRKPTMHTLAWFDPATRSFRQDGDRK